MSPLRLHDFIRELDETRTHHGLTSVREGAVMVEVAVPRELATIDKGNLS
jgi:hypothetical protein